MPVSPNSAPNASCCAECGDPHTENSVLLPGFGSFHPECVATCACSWAWPISLITTGEVIYYCGACALAAGRDELVG